MIVIEEASGVPDNVRQTLQGALSEPGARLIAPGNPTRSDGWFARDIAKTHQYAVHELDCRLSDHARTYSLPYRHLTGKVVHVRIRGFVPAAYWEGILADCDGDEDADYFRVRVRGLPPRSNVTQVLRREWVTDAIARERHRGSDGDEIVIGADFGLNSDKHAIAVRQGWNIRDLQEWLIPNAPTEQTNSAYRRIVDAVEQWRGATRGRIIIVGDSNGVGNGVMGRLTDKYRDDPRILVIHFNSGIAAADHRRYHRQRDYMWYAKGRAFFSNPNTSIPPKAGLVDELCAPGFEEDAAKKIKVETKKDIKKRTGQPSGNCSDAILHTLMAHTEEQTAEQPKDEEPRSVFPPVIQKHLDRLRHADDARSRFIH